MTWMREADFRNLLEAASEGLTQEEHTSLVDLAVQDHRWVGCSSGAWSLDSNWLEERSGRNSRRS